MRWRYARIFAAVIVAAAGSSFQTGVSRAATPWADRGWVDKGNMVYDNPKHGFHIVVPPNWLIDKAEQFDSTFLWSMKKFNAEGNQRAAFAIKVCPCQPKTAEQYYNDELAGFKQPAVAAQYRLLSSGPTSTPGVYDMQFIITASKMRARLLYFLRNRTPYVVIFSWAADPTLAELAELDSVRRAMGLPEARSASPWSSLSARWHGGARLEPLKHQLAGGTVCTRGSAVRRQEANHGRTV